MPDLIALAATSSLAKVLESLTATMRDPEDTVLHLLFARPEHDWAAETPLIMRRIEAGADIDAKAGGVTPMVIFVEQGFASDPATDELVEATLSRTTVDLSTRAPPSAARRRTAARESACGRSTHRRCRDRGPRWRS